MTAGIGTFHHDKIRFPAVSLPRPADQARRPAAGYHRRQHHIPVSRNFRKLQGQPRAGDNRIHAGLDGRVHQLSVFRGNHHGVDGDGTLSFRDFPGFSNFLFQSANARFHRMGPGVFFPKTDDRRGDDPHASFPGNGSRQGAHGDSNTHASLNDRHLPFFVHIHSSILSICNLYRLSYSFIISSRITRRGRISLM